MDVLRCGNPFQIKSFAQDPTFDNDLVKTQRVRCDVSVNYSKKYQISLSRSS